MLDTDFVHPWVADHQWNDQWQTKSVRYRPDSSTTLGRNDLMINQVRALFDSIPDDLDRFILASQICQAEALKFFIEFWRQQKGKKRGILWWNLRDGWPIVSDAVVDYYNTRKIAFRYIQRSQRDVQAICCEADSGRHHIVIVNDTLLPARGRLRVRNVASSLDLIDEQFEVEGNGIIRVAQLPHPDSTEMWSLEWSVNRNEHYASHYLASSGQINLNKYREWMNSLQL